VAMQGIDWLVIASAAWTVFLAAAMTYMLFL
jgi:hypothetical protein